MVQRSPALLLLSLVLLAPGAAFADAPKDLNACQSAVADAGAKYVGGVMDTLRSCLRSVSNAVVGGATTGAAATSSAKTCVAAFRKLQNSQRPAGTLGAVFAATVNAKCDPAVNPRLAHLDADTYTIGSATLGAASLATSCRRFGGDGMLSSFAAWRSCVRSAADCQARQAIAVAWPRALEYLAALKTAIAALPAATDRDDALAALTAFDAALEGSADDDVPEVACGAAPGGVLVTGQQFCSGIGGGHTTCPAYTPGQDGFWRAGVPFSYVDNGDGTITDEVTGLVWEKLGRDGSIHDVDFAETWTLASAQKIGELNRDAFAGHTDWRLPNRRELESILSFSGASPMVQPEFDDGCTPGCSAQQCSCTKASDYWSSTPYTPDASRRWSVSFADGSVVARDKDDDAALGAVRAVRGGSTRPVLGPEALKVD